ncbi:MAG TPA: hypothetical protein VIG76_11255, partial [Amnibacterium sp.]
LAAGAINPALATAQYAAIPERLLARALAAVNAIAWAGIPLGALLAGAVVNLVGLVPTLLVLGAVYGLVTLDPFLRRSWRAMDRDAGVPATESSSPRRADGDCANDGVPAPERLRSA